MLIGWYMVSTRTSAEALFRERRACSRKTTVRIPGIVGTLISMVSFISVPVGKRTRFPAKVIIHFTPESPARQAIFQQLALYSFRWLWCKFPVSICFCLEKGFLAFMLMRSLSKARERVLGFRSAV